MSSITKKSYTYSELVRDGQRPIIALRIVAGVSCLAALIVFGWSQTQFDQDVIVVEDLGAPFILPVIGVLIYGLVWSLMVVPIRLATPTPIHPAIYLTFDFIAWAGLLAMLIMYLLFMTVYNEGDGYSCSRYYRGDECIGKLVADAEHFATAMAFLATLIHFGLFVWACNITHKVRKAGLSPFKDGAILPNDAA